MRFVVDEPAKWLLLVKSAPLKYQRYPRGAVPTAETVKLALLERGTERFVGCTVMAAGTSMIKETIVLVEEP